MNEEIKKGDKVWWLDNDVAKTGVVTEIVTVVAEGEAYKDEDATDLDIEDQYEPVDEFEDVNYQSLEIKGDDGKYYSFKSDEVGLVERIL